MGVQQSVNKSTKTNTHSRGSGKTVAGLKASSMAAIRLKAGLVVAAFACLLYINTLDHDYALDDLPAIFGNSQTTQGLSGIPAILKTSYWFGYTGIPNNIYRPLSLVSFAIEWQIAPNNPHLGHLINILLYALSGFLLFNFLAILFNKTNLLISLSVALLFIAHPLHTEVVANIKSRDEILGFLFFLLAGIALLKSLDRPGWIYLGLTALYFFLSLLSKETSFTFLFLFPLALYFFRDLPVKKILRYTLLFAGVVFIQLLIRAWLLPSLSMPPQTDVNNNTFVLAKDFNSHTGTGFMILARYLQLLVFPHPLSCDYSYSQIPIVGLSNPLALAGLLVYTGLFILALMYFRKKHTLSFAILLFLIPLFPVSNLLFLTASTMAERFLYIPSLGFCLALVWILVDRMKINSSAEEYKSFSAMLRKHSRFFGLLSIVLFLYSFKTMERNKDWKNNYTLFSTDIKTCPNSARLHNIFAKYLFGEFQQGRVAESEKAATLNQIKSELDASLRLNPNFYESMFQFGEYYESLNQDSMAIIYYQQALTIKSDDEFARNNLIQAFIRKGDYDQAISLLKESIKSHPKEAKGYDNLGMVYFKLQRFPEAIELYNQVIALDPGYVEALDNLGSCYGMMKEFDKAIACFQKAIQLDPSNPSHYKNTGIAFMLKGDTATAQTFFSKAGELQSGNGRK